MEYTVTRKNFLEWYYNSGSDEEQESMRKDLAQHVIDNLFEDGECTVTVDFLFAECSIESIPSRLLNEIDRESDDFTEIGEDENINLSIDKINLVD